MRFSAYTALLNLPRLIVAMPRKTRIVMKSLAKVFRSTPANVGATPARQHEAGTTVDMPLGV
jgi:hypothetical protein